MTQFLGEPILGRLSDRYGPKPVLIVSQLGTLVGFIILGAANSLALLFLSRAIDGLSGANISTAQAAISDSTTPRTRTQGLGLIGVAFGLGFVVGPVIAFASLALGHDNYHVPAFIAAAPFVLFAAVMGVSLAVALQRLVPGREEQAPVILPPDGGQGGAAARP